MENDNAVIVLGIFLGVCLAAMLIVKIVIFLREFNDVVGYLTGEMRRAGDDDEYRYWRRELRCHYLCLIPFVTERNVMRVYRWIFYKPKHNEKLKRTDGIYHVLIPSIVGIAICAVCLGGVSWAWFTATATKEATTIKAASFQIDVTVTGSGGSTVTSDSDNKYTLSSGNYTLSFKAKEDNTSSKGYCCITVFKDDEIAGTNYYTNNIGGENPYTVTITNNETSSIEVKIESIWGDVEKVVGSGTGNRVGSNGTITVGQATSDDGKESNNLNALTETNNTDTNKSVAAEKTQGAASEEKPTETTENTEAETNLPEETTTEKTEETTAADSTEETTETDDQADTTGEAKTTEAAETGGIDETNQ